MRRSYINIKPIPPESYIYRIFSFERLIQLFRTRKNTLVHPRKWDDPFENFVLHAAHKSLSDGGEASWAQSVLAVKERLYGQCWSLSEESDAMWRIYSPSKSGVKVRTTVGKLLHQLKKSAEGQVVSPPFIGKVRYMKDKSLRKRLEDPKWLYGGVETVYGKASSLFVKRKEFRHEEEVRLVVLNSEANLYEETFQYTIDPCELIDEIVLDPRLSDELFEVYKSFLIQELKHSKKIRRSLIYSVPDLGPPNPGPQPDVTAGAVPRG